MEYNINKEVISTSEILFEGCQEQPIDLDFSLPDYCPDIQKILKCQVCPRIMSKNISGDRLEVDGTVIVRLIYIDSVRNGVRCCENSIPFSSMFNLDSSVQNGVALTSTKIEYVNCRALNSRRLDIHGAFSVCSKVISKENYEIGTYSDNEDIEQKKEKVFSNNVVGIGQQQFSIDEDIKLSSEQSEIENIIRFDVSICLDDCKSVVNKLIIKGTATIHILYSSDIDDGNLETMEYSIPINEMIDVDGVDENSVCDVKLELLNYEITTNSNSDDSNIVKVEMKIIATGIAYIEQEIDLLTDAYSKMFETDMEYKKVKIPKLIDKVNSVNIDKNTIEMGENGISKVIDIWNDVVSVNCKLDKNKLIFTGKMNICILAYNKENEPFYLERVVDFEHEYILSGEPVEIECNPEICVLAMSYRITSTGELEVRSELKIEATVYEIKTYNFIDSIFVNEDQIKEIDSDSALVIYYADRGENLWDIARKHCTSVDSIKKENEIEDDKLEHRTMLLIPITSKKVRR